MWEKSMGTTVTLLQINVTRMLTVFHNHNKRKQSIEFFSSNEKKKILINVTFHLKRSLVKPPAVEEATSFW